MLKRLSQGEWFSSRTSSASLYASVYPRVSSETQAELRKLFTTLGGDDTPMVRRAVSKWLGVGLSVSCRLAFVLIAANLHF